MLFNKVNQLGRVAQDLLDGTATLPDVELGHVERIWPVLLGHTVGAGCSIVSGVRDAVIVPLRTRR